MARGARRVGIALAVFGLAFAMVPGGVRAQSEELRRELEAMRKQLREMQEQLKKQQELIDKLSTGAQAPAAGPPPTAVAKAARGEDRGGGGGRRRAAPPPDHREHHAAAAAQLAAANKTFPSQFNPAIGLILDNVASYAEKERGDFEFRAAELGISASVDPFARGYAIFNGTNDGFEVEEAAIVTTSLPYNLT
jgi:hypothetical protein